MEKIKEIYDDYRDYILCSLIFIFFSICLIFIFWYFSNNINSVKKQIKEKEKAEVKKEEKTKEEYWVDIKGEVKRPGVYLLEKGKRVIDVVNKAGGFTVYADSSANNLSMKIADEMVIIIYSEDEIRHYVTTKKKQELIQEKCKSDIVTNNSCVESSNEISKEDSKKNNKNNSNSNNSKTDKNSTNSSKEDNKLISINTATKEELMTLSGIGESKADAIIEYRKNKKFATIEEIKEVSGIGDALFEKIKDSITV